MPQVILISQVPLPFSNIGSWTTLYKNYLNGEHQVDWIICEAPEQRFENVSYGIVKNNFITRVVKKWRKSNYLGYLEELDKVIDSNEKYLIQIIDNFGIIKPLETFLQKKDVRKNCYLQFFYHGYPPFYGNFESRWFFESIDEMVLLTHDSYQAHKNQYTILPTRFSILYNGIDTTKFYPVSVEKKIELKKNKMVQEKRVFVWCSQDRPKKGLHILLDAWKRVYKERQNMVLWVIGCEPKTPQDGVCYLGKVPNDELPIYFQTSDCYLFPTLWHEGFGMSLIEALHCGNYCIASSIGGVPEVLQHGKLGKLIENPHFVNEWEKAIVDFMESPPPKVSVPAKLYSSESWLLGMNNIINRAKQSVSV
jgi:glycosyltransferase involved in cell wall biosynthesis